MPRQVNAPVVAATRPVRLVYFQFQRTTINVSRNDFAGGLAVSD